MIDHGLPSLDTRHGRFPRGLNMRAWTPPFFDRRWVLAVVAPMAWAVTACGSTVATIRSGPSGRPVPAGLRANEGAARACRYGAAFAAIASATNFPVACPSWLPEHARPIYFTVAEGSVWQIEFRGSAVLLDATPPPPRTPTGRLLLHVSLPGGYRVVMRGSAREITATVLTGAAAPIEQLRLRGTQPGGSHLQETMRRIVSSLAIRQVPVPIRGRCSYAPLFATMALVAGSRDALCPRWLPNVSLPTATAGYGTSVVELYGPAAGLPHIVFDWTRAARPPGKLTAVLLLGHGHRVPIYLNASLGQALFSNHYTAVVAGSPHGSSLWVSWHRYYDNRRRDLRVLTRIIRSMVRTGS